MGATIVPLIGAVRQQLAILYNEKVATGENKKQKAPAADSDT
jgi:hypothetical protein